MTYHQSDCVLAFLASRKHGLVPKTPLIARIFGARSSIHDRRPDRQQDREPDAKPLNPEKVIEQNGLIHACQKTDLIDSSKQLLAH